MNPPLQSDAAKRLHIVALLAAALAQLHAAAQEPTGPDAPPDPAAQTAPVVEYTLREDLKGFATWPKEWRGRDWLKFTGVVAAVNVAYRRDDEIREQYKNDGEPDYHEVLDALPTAATFGGMWIAGKVAGNEEAMWEANVMRRALVVEIISVQLLKVGFGRERPRPGVPKDEWILEGTSFPSGHTAAAFAVGTVLAESGSDKHRALRRTLGYGLGVAMGYQRVNHDAHWFSDTVAGAAIGIAAAKFVMRRREGSRPHGQLWLQPVDDGLVVSYTVPLR